MKLPITTLIAATLLLGGCGGSPSKSILASHVENSTREGFLFCSDYGCTTRWTMVLTDEEWAKVATHFTEPATDAAAERTQIAMAIGEIEVITGKKAGTSQDKPGATILVLGSTKGQLDCIDEAHNTSVYLEFMARDGWLKFHTIGEPIKRGMVIDRWFHNTATVVETETGVAWVIDSWFGANGEPADVVTAEAWMDGWEPEKFASRPDR